MRFCCCWCVKPSDFILHLFIAVNFPRQKIVFYFLLVGINFQFCSIFAKIKRRLFYADTTNQSMCFATHKRLLRQTCNRNELDMLSVYGTLKSNLVFSG